MLGNFEMSEQVIYSLFVSITFSLLIHEVRIVYFRLSWYMFRIWECSETVYVIPVLV